MKTVTTLILTALLAACGGGEDLPEARVAAVNYSPSPIACAAAIVGGFKGECK